MPPPLGASLQQLEWRLLFSSLSGPPPEVAGAAADAAAPDELAVSTAFVELIERGQYLDVLAHPLAASIVPQPPPFTPGVDADATAAAAALAAAAYYGDVRAAFASRRAASTDTPAAAARAFELLCVGAAALMLSLQANVTGPAPGPAPACPGALAHGTAVSAAADCHAVWDAWAVTELSADGEDVVGKAALPQYLVLARIALLEEELAASPMPEVDSTTQVIAADLVCGEDAEAAAARVEAGGLRTGMWWAARAALLQQRLLARGAASLRSALVALFARTLAVHAPPGVCGRGSRRVRRVAAAAQLEAALMEHEYRRSEAAEAQLEACLASLRLQHEVQGAMGVRTVHQTEAKAQMVLRCRVDPDAELAEEAGELLPPLPGAAAGEDEAAADGDAPPPPPPRASAMLAEEEPDVLLLPSLLGADGDAAPAQLPALEQAAVLAGALGVRKGRAADELRAWEMAPYVEAVRAQARGAPTLRAAADLLASRHERTRGRTRMRALASLEALAESLSAASPPASARARLAFAAWLPPAPALRRELGEQLLSAGLVGAAMSLFEALELWDALLVCLQLAGKRAEAGALVRRRLEVTPRDARLWCALGDATGDETHYRTAWEVSGGRNARAQRSLARGASGRGEWPACVAAWEAALAINPLHAEGWFGLGYACMKLRDEARALVAFSRVTAQEPENGEAWNNVAALSLSAGRNGAALAALQECVKHKRDAWPIWDNLATVAARCAAWPTAANAAATLLRLTSGKRAPEQEVLEALVTAVEALPPPGSGGAAEPPLVGQVAAVLQAAAAGGAGGAELWGAYARFRAARGDATAAAECLARRVRALQDGGWERERAAFDAYADALCALAEAHLQHGGARDLSGARMQLRGALKRAAELFEDAPPYARLQQALTRVSAREDELRAV